MSKVVAEFSPTMWVVEKASNIGWDFAGEYQSLEKATVRAKDLAQFYGLRSRVLEVPK